MTATQPFDNPTPICGACGGICNGGYSFVLDLKTHQERDRRCHDCAERERWEEYRATRILRTKLLMDAAHEGWLVRNHYPSGWKRIQAAQNLLDEVIEASIMLDRAATMFEREVWFNGLQPQVIAAKRHGQSVDTNRLKWLVFATAGRCLNTLEDDHNSITLITAEEGQTPESEFRESRGSSETSWRSSSAP